MVKEMKHILNSSDMSWTQRWNTIVQQIIDLGHNEKLQYNNMKNGKQLYMYEGFTFLVAHPSLIALMVAWA